MALRLVPLYFCSGIYTAQQHDESPPVATHAIPNNTHLTQHCSYVYSTAGVKIPKFEQLHTGGENNKISLTGLGSGGQQIQTCRKAFMNSIELLVQLASLQTAFLTLDEAIKTTNRRVNALDNVVRPKLENTIAYIKVRKANIIARGSMICMHNSCSFVSCAALGASRLLPPREGSDLCD